MTARDLLPVDRFLNTLAIVRREGKHLRYSTDQLAREPIDPAWVGQLEQQPDKAVILEAFISRFGRMQDTIADKLLPRWLAALAETPGSQIEVLDRAERLGIIDSVTDWLSARKLRNLLIHEYMIDAERFAQAIHTAQQHVPMLLTTYERLRRYALDRLALDPDQVPPPLTPDPS